MRSIDLWPMTMELIEEVHGEEGQFNFSEKAKKSIKEISEYAKETNIWKKNKENADQFWSEIKDVAAEQVYCYLLDRIAFAPTKILRDGSILLLVPKLDEMLNGMVQ